MASSEVIAQNGHFKHPYLYALVRWLVSSFWSSATLLLHRLVTAPLPPVTVFPSPRSKQRPASSDHLHPEPLVECVVLQTPENPTIDVVFVHGLYGSLGNTWRQGEWMARYKSDPQKVPLRRPHSINTCTCDDDKDICDDDGMSDGGNYNGKDEVVVGDDEDIYNNIRKMLPDGDIFITDKFYNNTLLDQVEIVGNYETQAKFVRELFVCDDRDGNENEMKCEMNNDKEGYKKCDEVKHDCACKTVNDREVVNEKCEVSDSKVQCEVGCGCVCDDCYSPCWPRDWIKVDYPGARVISINYTSDPHLWRPLWVKQSKRLQLHERAEQMMSQLLALGVGERPIIWVGHSKGGLFIKQLYCEAYEAHVRAKSEETVDAISGGDKNVQTIINNKNNTNGVVFRVNNNKCDNNTECDDVYNNNNNNNNNNNGIINYVNDKVNDNSFINDNEFNVFDDERRAGRGDVGDVEKVGRVEHLINIPPFEEDTLDVRDALLLRSRLWRLSAGFMFYSVPHRGSPLADIKTPITARSVELMEICKDCELVLSLQERWVRATSTSQPKVRSLVETCKTLMSVLWLRIVSVDSADPGIGSLHGVNVDHREICKPASRRCLLYRELMALMSSALKTAPH